MFAGCAVCLQDVESCLCKGVLYGQIASHNEGFFGLHNNALSLPKLNRFFFYRHATFTHFEAMQKVHFLKVYRELNVLDSYNMKI